jgi:2-keto-3-deoxy-L-rhamnonate aldolase RhmA
VPHIEGVEGARKAVAAVRYPPEGERGGAGSTRAAGYGAAPWTEHMRTSNEEILLIIMTEDQRGLDELEEIAALDGVDIISLGPTDISTALGMTDPNDPRLRQTFVNLAERINAVGRAKVYIPVNHSALRLSPQELLEMGVNYTSVAPAPPTIVLNALRDSAARIREETARAAVA